MAARFVYLTATLYRIIKFKWSPAGRHLSAAQENLIELEKRFVYLVNIVIALLDKIADYLIEHKTF